MAIKQLSIYAENAKGSLAHITNVLYESGIDIRSLCIADTSEYGIIRITTSDAEQALTTVKNAGLTANIRDVIAIAIPDVPGGLNTVLQILDKNNINLEYAYSLISDSEQDAFIVLRVDDNDKTEKVLKENGVRVLTEEALYDGK